jgi:hypothetical protein
MGHIGEHPERATPRKVEIMSCKRGWMNPKLNATKMPSELDVAWAAGLYEGEGTCCWKPTTRTVKGRVYHGASDYLSVTQKDPEVLYRLRDLFGGSVYEYMVNDLPCSRWTVHGQRARNFAEKIYSFLSARRKMQIDKVRAAYSHSVETERPSLQEEMKFQSDLHGNMQSATEMIAPTDKIQ